MKACLKLFSLFIILCFTTLPFSTSQSQEISEEGECEILVFLGTRTYPPGSSNPFEWECRQEFTSCTEVYIICPRT